MVMHENNLSFKMMYHTLLVRRETGRQHMRVSALILVLFVTDYDFMEWLFGVATTRFLTLGKSLVATVAALAPDI